MKQIDTPPPEIVADQKLLRSWVIYQLAMQGRSLAEVARQAGVRRQTIYQPFLRSYPRMEKLVADALGLPPQTLWPERYDKHGLPTRRRGLTHKRGCHGSKDTSATDVNTKGVA